MSILDEFLAQHELVLVEWADPAGTHGWTSKTVSAAGHAISIGILHETTERAVVLLDSKILNDEDIDDPYGCSLYIPMSNVISIHKLGRI